METRHKRSGPFPLLLTGTIDTGVFGNNNVVLTDTAERLSQYVEVITNYIQSSPFDPIVFAENSGYPFPVDHLKGLAANAGKQFEYLFVETSKEKTAAFGKSFGEAYLITQAIEACDILKNKPYVYKCTGRVFLQNADEICRKAVNGRSEFITIRHREACLTVFFKLSLADYQKGLHVLPDYCSEKEGMDIERGIYRLLHEKGIAYACFSVYPRLHGICGTNGGQYDKSSKNLRIKNQMLRLGLFRDGKLSRVQQAVYRFVQENREDWFW